MTRSSLQAPLRLLVPVLLTASACHPVVATHVVSLPPAAPADDATAPRARVIALRPVVDARVGKPELVGRVNPLLTASAFFSRTENIVTKDDVPAWVLGSLRRELEVVGFRVVERAPEAGEPALTPVVQAVFCEVNPESFYESAIDVRATITSGQASLLDRVYKGRTRSDVSYSTGPTDAGYTACLVDGLRETTQIIAADVARVLTAPKRP